MDHLLRTGANVHARDDGGLIPLHNACSFGHSEVRNLTILVPVSVVDDIIFDQLLTRSHQLFANNRIMMTPSSQQTRKVREKEKGEF